VQHHGAVVAGFDAPSAAVAFVFVDKDYACFFRLRQGVSGARVDACRFLAESAGDGHVYDLVLAYGAYSGFDGVEGFLFVV